MAFNRLNLRRRCIVAQYCGTLARAGFRMGTSSNHCSGSRTCQSQYQRIVLLTLSPMACSRALLLKMRPLSCSKFCLAHNRRQRSSDWSRSQRCKRTSTRRQIMMRKRCLQRSTPFACPCCIAKYTLRTRLHNGSASIVSSLTVTLARMRRTWVSLRSTVERWPRPVFRMGTSSNHCQTTLRSGSRTSQSQYQRIVLLRLSPMACLRALLLKLRPLSCCQFCLAHNRQH